jgi:hypothetical protein
MDDVRQEGADLQGDPDEVQNAAALMLKPPVAAVNERNDLVVSMQQRLPVMVALGVVIGLGLASRTYDGLFPNALEKYPGDALWTVAVYLGWKLVFPAMVPWKLGLMALGQSVGVEFLQLYHAPWLDGIRGNRFGHLLFGSTFNPMDLVAYSVGAAVVFLIDRFLGSRGPLSVRRA